MTDSEFLRWIHARLVLMHGENSFYDYMIRLQRIADTLLERENNA